MLFALSLSTSTFTLPSKKQYFFCTDRCTAIQADSAFRHKEATDTEDILRTSSGATSAHATPSQTPAGSPSDTPVGSPRYGQQSGGRNPFSDHGGKNTVHVHITALSLFFFILYDTEVKCSLVYCTALYSAVLYFTHCPYCTALPVLHCTVLYCAQCCAVLYLLLDNNITYSFLILKLSAYLHLTSFLPSISLQYLSIERVIYQVCDLEDHPIH